MCRLIAPNPTFLLLHHFKFTCFKKPFPKSTLHQYKIYRLERLFKFKNKIPFKYTKFQTHRTQNRRQLKSAPPLTRFCVLQIPNLARKFSKFFFSGPKLLRGPIFSFQFRCLSTLLSTFGWTKPLPFDGWFLTRHEWKVCFLSLNKFIHTWHRLN